MKLLLISSYVSDARKLFNFDASSDVPYCRSRQVFNPLAHTNSCFSETTAYSLCFGFMLLALYSDIQRKVYEEVKALSTGDGEKLVR